MRWNDLQAIDLAPAEIVCDRFRIGSAFLRNYVQASTQTERWKDDCIAEVCREGGDGGEASGRGKRKTFLNAYCVVENLPVSNGDAFGLAGRTGSEYHVGDI